MEGRVHDGEDAPAVPAPDGLSLAHAQSAEEAIRAQDDAFATAFNAGDGEAVGALYTEDAMILPPGEQLIEGREAITQFWQGGIDAGLADLELTSLEIVAEENAAHEVGELSLTAPGEGGESQTVAGKYVVVWQKGDDGTWRLHRDIWNLSPAE